MQDSQLLALFQSRDETALKEAELRFGAQCRGIAKRILGNSEDAEECWNDVLLRLWNTIPPAKPQYLAAYISVSLFSICQAVYAQKRCRAGQCQNYRKHTEPYLQQHEFLLIFRCTQRFTVHDRQPNAFR